MSFTQQCETVMQRFLLLCDVYFADVIPSGFHSCCGKNITFRNNKTAVVRTSAFNNGVTFSSKPLEDDEIFEVTTMSLFLIKRPW